MGSKFMRTEVGGSEKSGVFDKCNLEL